VPCSVYNMVRLMVDPLIFTSFWNPASISPLQWPQICLLDSWCNLSLVVECYGIHTVTFIRWHENNSRHHAILDGRNHRL
jgi:hypothetical protein